MANENEFPAAADHVTANIEVLQGNQGVPLPDRFANATIELVSGLRHIGKIALRGDVGEMLRAAANHLG